MVPKNSYKTTTYSFKPFPRVCRRMHKPCFRCCAVLQSCCKNVLIAARTALL